jgi:cytosine permease
MIGVTLIGFFGVTAELFGDSLSKLSLSMLGFEAGRATCIITGGALMILTAIYGFQGLKRLADIAVPVKFIGLGWIVLIAMRDHQVSTLFTTPSEPSSLGVGISAVIGSLAVGVTVFPDLARFARSAGHAQGAAIGSFSVAFPIVLMLAAIPSVVTHEPDLVTIMVLMGLGFPAFILLVFAAWTTNTSNLYSASLGLANLLRRCSFPLLASGAGAVGIALALFGVTSHLMPYLVILSITIPPIAGVYIADFYFVRGQRYDQEALESLPALAWPAFLAWGLAVGIALATAGNLFRLTGVPACDSILIAFLSYTALNVIRAGAARRSATTANIKANLE